MNYLQLVQMAVRQSGTIQETASGAAKPTTVTGQINRLKQIVEYVSEAYVDIQNAHRMWRWLQSDFIGPTSIGVRSYAGTAFNDEWTGTPITRFSQWGSKQDGTDVGTTIYKTSEGAEGEGHLRWMDWDGFRDTQLRGVRPPGKPQVYSITNDGKLIISPTPDAVYTIRGRYRKSAQVLTADADVPEMPADFHTVIKDAALCYIEGFDEGPRIPVYRLRMLPNWSMLEHQQLPKVKWGAPLA